MPAGSNNRNTISLELAAQLAQLEKHEQTVNETTWAHEQLAHQCGHVFEAFWDALNRAPNRLEVAGSFPLGKLILAAGYEEQQLLYGIALWKPAAARKVLSQSEWRTRLEQWQLTGWHLDNLEFRHVRFDPPESGTPGQSRFAFSAHLTNRASPERASVDGDLIVTWTNAVPGQPPAVQQIDAGQVQLKTCKGEPMFRPVLADSLPPPEKARYLDPLIAYDLDGDGLSEIILAAKNLVYRWQAGQFKAEPLCRHPSGGLWGGLIADFDGDAHADFLCGTLEGLVLFEGSPEGKFEQPGVLVWRMPSDVRSPMALTCGDVDADGDLDVFLVQYKLPYEGGQMPTPYYDANDGDPAYLLLNNGHGRFTDGTISAGLEKKRWRRSYGTSLVDLNRDGHLDLVVVSDFAGVDLYRNNGHGRFNDVTGPWVLAPHAFAMAHTCADFNLDGRLDLLLMGMPSATAERLEHLRLWRPDGPPADRFMRREMIHGNHLYLAQEREGFTESALSASIARSGWSWGCAALDFDNDRFPDVYVGNGMESRESVRDYEGEFWLHDTYVANSTNNPSAYLYLKNKVARLRSHGESYGGYEKNRFFWNQGAERFVEVGHLLGLALEQDTRNVLAEDLDGDGRVDLLMTHYDPWPSKKQTLRVFRNECPSSGHWIGFRFREEGSGTSPVGVAVEVEAGQRTALGQVVAGESYRSQRAATLHFGLGEVEHVDRVVIRWANGRTQTLRDPAVDRYHSVRAGPKKDSGLQPKDG